MEQQNIQMTVEMNVLKEKYDKHGYKVLQLDSKDQEHGMNIEILKNRTLEHVSLFFILLISYKSDNKNVSMTFKTVLFLPTRLY